MRQLQSADPALRSWFWLQGQGSGVRGHLDSSTFLFQVSSSHLTCARLDLRQNQSWTCGTWTPKVGSGQAPQHCELIRR